MSREHIPDQVVTHALQLGFHVGAARQLANKVQTDGPPWLCERLEAVHARLVEAQTLLIEAFADNVPQLESADSARREETCHA